MEKLHLLKTWQSQLKKGYLELCILLILKNQKNYGFELLKTLQQSGIDVNEGTLYPLLNRMHKNGWLESEWEAPTEGGHPRRFYQLNNKSKDLLPQMLETYKKNSHAISQLES